MSATQLQSALEARQSDRASLRSADSATSNEGEATAGKRDAVAFGAARLLCLAASPIFATMTVLTNVFHGTAMQNPSRLSGMVTMYLLMGVVHLPPWLELIATRRNRHRVRRNPDKGTVDVGSSEERGK